MSPHLSIEDLALLAEGRATPDEAASMQEHLSTCRSCMAAYVDAVRYHAAWTATPHAFEGSVAPAHSAPAFRIGRGLAAAAAIVAAGGLSFALLRSADERAAAMPLPPPVHEAVETASAHGLVLPGGERAAARVEPVMRSGAQEPSDALIAEVEAAVRAYETPPPSAHEARVLVSALLVSNEFEAARDYVEEALVRFPDDTHLPILAAAVAQRRGDPARAEAHLRTLISRQPGDALALLNLGIVLDRSGRREEARETFARVIMIAQPPEIVARARRELEAGVPEPQLPGGP